MQRNLTIDLARWFWALMVVIIHVPILGRNILLPFCRCAVPFYFLITGYYLYRNGFKDSLYLKSFKKWGGVLCQVLHCNLFGVYSAEILFRPTFSMDTK